MTAYVLGIRNSLMDADAYERYGEAAAPTLDGTGAHALALYGRCRVLEGAEAEGAFLLAFPSYDAAESWFDGPEYQAAMKIRDGAADYRIILVEGAK